jgi:hypothetical protein
MTMTDDGLDEFRTLVRAAFQQARRSGKQDWEEMTSAVLKNRLLNLTRGQFSEDRYKSPSFIHLVRRIPDLVTITSPAPPFSLRLVQPVSAEDVVHEPSGESPVPDAKLSPGFNDQDLPRVRVRPDLWHAIIDYSAGKPYVLDPETGQARPWNHGDLTLPQFPTASRETIASWRHDFIQSLDVGAQEKFGNSLSIWADGRGRQADLPGSLRGDWGGFLKRKVIQALLSWYESQGIQQPEDMVVLRESQASPPSEAISEVVEAQRLRDALISVIRVMTHDELSRVSLPASAWLRVYRDEPKHEK